MAMQHWESIRADGAIGQPNMNSTEEGRCGFCGKHLNPDGASFYFCSPVHQERWMEDRSTDAREIVYDDEPPPRSSWSLGSVSMLERAMYLSGATTGEQMRDAVRTYSGRSVLFDSDRNRRSIREVCPEMEAWLDANDEWEKPLVQEETFG